MNWTEHLEELRKRIIVCLIAIFICGIISYFYADKILLVLSQPVGKLIFIKPAEAFFTKLKIAVYSGLFISMPVIIYQIWKFVSPGLLKIEKIYLYWLVPVSYLLFVLGTTFSFFVVLPPGIKFLLNAGSDIVQPMISVNYYISFVTIFLFGFGIMFQMPLVVIFLTKTGIITPQWLVRNRKYVVLIVFVLAGILTPGPDIFSQFMMAVPALILYEIGILISKLVR